MYNGLDCMFDVELINSSPKHIPRSSYNGPRWDLNNKALDQPHVVDYIGAKQSNTNLTCIREWLPLYKPLG